MRRVSIGIGVPVGTSAAACVIIGLSLNAAAQTQRSSLDADLASACRKLGTTSFEQIPGAPTWIISAIVVAANGGQAAYCEIKGHVLQHVGLQMRLPLEGWNNKLYMNGNHGLGGHFFMDECEGALARNYAIGTTDMGHSGRVTDGGFAYDNMQGKIDFRIQGNTRRGDSGEGDRESLLRAAGYSFLFQWLFDRWPPSVDGSTALSGRFRWHHRWTRANLQRRHDGDPLILG
jgi:hypothetical protein